MVASILVGTSLILMATRDLLKGDRDSVRRVLHITLFIDTLIFIIAIFGGVALGEPPDYNFREEGFMTYVSCLQLFIATVISWRIFWTFRNSQNPQLAKQGIFWLVASIGLLFLTLDDGFEIHEQIDFWLHGWFNLQETAITDLADDLIVIGYLLFFVVYAFFQRQIIKRFQSAFSFFIVGFGLTIVMVIFDVVSNNSLFTSMIIDDAETENLVRQWISAIEDSAKLYAEGMFIVGIYKCLQIARTIVSKQQAAIDRQ